MARVDYDAMAGDYVEGRALPPAGLEPWRVAIQPWLPGDGGGSPVLDLGAGTGQFAAAIAGWLGVRVVAVEPSAGMRAQAASVHPHPAVALLGGRAERLPLRDACCAWAWVSTVVHHLDDLPAVARRLGGPLLLHGDVGEGADEGRRGVHQLDAVEGEAGGLRLLPGGDVDVVEDLQVVGEELDGDDQDRLVAGG